MRALAPWLPPLPSPLTSLLLAMNMSATLFKLRVEECLSGVTREAARALGPLEESGTIEAGKSADFAVWSVESLAEFVYRIRHNPLSASVFKEMRVAR